MPVPVRLTFQPSQVRRKEQQLAKMSASENARAAHNTNLYPSLSSSITVAPYADAAFDVEAADMPHDSLIPQDPNARPRCFRNLFEECIFVFAVMMATSSTTFLQGVIVINTATIGSDLKMSEAQITWIAAAIGLASGSFMLFFGKTADLFGRKPQLLAGMASLSLFSLITSFAPNPMAMNILCGFLGLGTAVISPPAIGTLFATYPQGRRQNRAAGALGSANPIGFILGSISSGVATKLYSWRASFIVISIFFFVMTLLAFWTMPAIARSGDVRKELKRFDWLGTMLTIMGMALFCAALTEGPVKGWKSKDVIIMLLLGFFLLFGFGFWENVYKFPLLHPSIWKNRNFTLCVLSAFFGYMSFITNQFWTSLYMQDVQHLAPLHIAVRMLPQAIAGIFWSYIGQGLVHRLSGTVIMGLGALAYLTGAVLLIFIREHTSYWALLFPSLMITVLGADFQFIVSNIYVNKQMPTQASLGAGVLQTGMRLSVSLGLSITAAVYGSSVSTSQARKDITFAFDRAYLCSIMFALTGLLFVPFLRIGKQGGTIETEEHPPGTGQPSQDPEMAEQQPPRSGGEYTDSESQTPDDDLQISWSNTNTSFTTAGTWGSERSYFPRWSWEEERNWREQRYRDFSGEGNVIYEVCIKCLEERRVVLGGLDYDRPNSHGYEPQPVRGGDLGTQEARTYEVRLSTPRASGGTTASQHVGKGGEGWL